ncbi:MAG: hypothetical protein LBP96_01895 [Bacteroidales bacterium]|jgi:hypothetical protein|nr:hypothetical protein [Bacteroidales bacterium]
MNKVTKNISLFTICLFLAFNGGAQQPFDFAKAEMDLVKFFETVTRGENHHIRYNANENFLELLKKTLAENGAFDYPFAHLNCAKLMPPDKKFRIFNWMVLKEDGMEYFALMLVHNERKKTYEIIQLVDESDAILDLQNVILDKDNWFCAYYYEVIQTETSGRKYYTFLGANGNDKTVSRRVVEVLTFKPNGDLVFGANVFSWRIERGNRRVAEEKFNRKVFEFSRRGTMILRYDYQAYTEPVGTPKPGEKQKEKIIRANMIVFDRLAPPNPELYGSSEAYIAAGGVYDALVWLNGKWTLKLDVMARNPAPPKKKRWWLLWLF